MKNNNKKYPKINNKQQKGKSPIIQNYVDIVATLPTLGLGIWIIGGFILSATGQPITGELELILPILISLFKG